MIDDRFFALRPYKANSKSLRVGFEGTYASGSKSSIVMNGLREDYNKKNKKKL